MNASTHYKAAAKVLRTLSKERMKMPHSDAAEAIQLGIAHALLSLAAPRVVAVGQIRANSMDLVWSDGTITQYDW